MSHEAKVLSQADAVRFCLGLTNRITGKVCIGYLLGRADLAGAVLVGAILAGAVLAGFLIAGALSCWSR